MNSSVLQRISASQSKRLEDLRKDDGFSLLELVTAVGVLLILVIIGLSSYNAVQNNSKQSATNKAVDEVYGKAFSTLVDEDASTSPLQVQDEYNNSSKNVKVSVEELGNDRITVRAFLKNDAGADGNGGEEEFVAVKTTPAVDGSENAGGNPSNPPGSGGEETTPPIIGNTFSTAIMKCDATTTAPAPFVGFEENTEVTIQEVGKPETFKMLNSTNYYDDYRERFLNAGGTEESLDTIFALNTQIINKAGVDLSYEAYLANKSTSVTYEAGVEYEVKIDGHFNWLNGRDAGCLRTVALNDSSGVKQLDFGSNVEQVPDNIPSSIRILSNAFERSRVNDSNIGNWDVSNVRIMNSMFSRSQFNQSLSNWDVSNVTDMSLMFQYNDEFDQDISDWDVSNVTDMTRMFLNADSFNNGGQPLDWSDTGKLTDINGMFWNAKTFNQDIGSWDTSKVTNMDHMFTDARMFNQNIDGWDVSNVSNMNNMFQNATRFNQNLGSWKVPKISTKPPFFDDLSPFKNRPVSEKPQWGVA